MGRFVQPLVVRIQRGRRQHADRAGQHGGGIRQDIAEHVAGDDDVELLRRTYQLHCCVVDIHVVQRDVRILGVHLGDDLFPELEGLQHVGLVDAGQAVAALAGGLEGDMGDAADFGLRVAHGVEALALAGERAIDRNAHTARLAEIDVAGQFADDQDIESGHHLRLQRGGAG